jgi:hypothetical protein
MRHGRVGDQVVPLSNFAATIFGLLDAKTDGGSQ